MGKDDVKLIVEGLLNGIYNILNGILSGLNIPSIPPEMDAALSEFWGYLYYARNFVALVLPINFNPYFVIYFAILAFKYGYPIIMWILRKIPMLGIE